MKQKKKMGQTAGGVICLILFTLMAAFLIFVEGDVLFGKSENFYDLEAKEGIQKDQYVSIPVDAVLANYAETKHTVNFIPVGKDQHFIIWLNGDSMISLTIKNKKTVKELNKICDQTWDYLDGVTDSLPDTITLRGVIHTMDSEIEGYYDDALDMIGVSDTDMNVYYVTIDCTETQFKTVCYLLFCILMIAISIWMIVSDRKHKKKLAQAQAQAAANAANVGSAFSNNMMGDMNASNTTYGTPGNYDGVNQDLLK